MADERFDEVLLQMAGQLGGIAPLFDAVFSFLYRKTDYFHIMQPGDTIGFKEGAAEQILLKSFKQFELQARMVAQRKSAKAAKAAAPKPSTTAKKEAAPQPVKDPAPSDPPAKPNPATEGGAQEAGGKPPAVPPSAPNPASVQEPAKASSSSDGDAGRDAGAAALSSVGAKSSSHLSDQVGTPYNGGRCERFDWEQTLHDLTIHAPVPVGTKARDVICTISKNHLLLKLRGQPEPLIDADYPCDARNGQEIWERVRTVDCYWNLAESKGKPCVCVYLEKERESWWKSAVHGDKEIDTTKVDSTRDMYDYDDETQGAIRKIMFDQHQKRMGQPTSEDMQNEDMLRKAWDAEGSPFKGQPFDPSAIKMQK